MKEHATAIFSLDLIFVTTGGGLIIRTDKWLAIRVRFFSDPESGYL